VSSFVLTSYLPSYLSATNVEEAHELVHEQQQPAA
jgi:hypothetical protein